MNKATLRLFNAIEVNKKDNKNIPQSILARTIQNGYVLDSGIEPDEELLDLIESVALFMIK